mmetsp:Transcript_2080/g.4774  ORF Transcript_2080/g.4774 Transcript_2080/m.4774 type:complete len:237 (-) Transcript_2080:357-1067(-)
MSLIKFPDRSRTSKLYNLSKPSVDERELHASLSSVRFPHRSLSCTTDEILLKDRSSAVRFMQLCKFLTTAKELWERFSEVTQGRSVMDPSILVQLLCAQLKVASFCQTLQCRSPPVATAPEDEVEGSSLLAPAPSLAVAWSSIWFSSPSSDGNGGSSTFLSVSVEFATTRLHRCGLSSTSPATGCVERSQLCISSDCNCLNGFSCTGVGSLARLWSDASFNFITRARVTCTLSSRW